jgi:ABC-type transport system substrate-binding protein
MAEAGYANGFKTTIIMNPLTAGRDVVVAIQSYLKVLGIDAALDFPEFSKYQPTYLMGTWKNALLYQVFPGFGNYNSTLQIYFTPGNAFLKSWVRTEEFTKLFNATLNSVNPDISLIRAAFNEIQRTASVIPINESGKVWAVHPYVKNAGLFERSLSPYWKPEQAWLNR